MHVIFANYHWFDNTSGIHIFHLANELERRGVRCTALIPRRPESVTTFGTPRFSVGTFRQATLRYALRGRRREDKDVLVHAWTPREIVRRASRHLAARWGAPYLVHLEDNERHIYLANRAAVRSAGQPWNRPAPKQLIHPRHWRSFLADAAGLTCIVDSLLRFCPAHVPGLVFWPACEAEIFTMPLSPDSSLRHSFGIPDGTLVLFYPGNVHLANIDDLLELYRAVTILARRGLPICLVRTGEVHGDIAARLDPPPNLLDLGHRPASDMPRLLGVADILVQPGRPDAFNIYRFPCKLPMFLASGRPVVLPACNIGNHLRDGEHCLITRTGSAEEMAEKVARLATDPALRLRLGTNGRAFANAHLRWDVAAERLIKFYQQVLATASVAQSSDRSIVRQPPTELVGPSASDGSAAH